MHPSEICLNNNIPNLFLLELGEKVYETGIDRRPLTYLHTLHACSMQEAKVQNRPESAN